MRKSMKCAEMWRELWVYFQKELAEKEKTIAELNQKIKMLEKSE